MLLNITILELAPTVTYSLENLTLIRGETMDTLEPQLVAGFVDNWSIIGSLPEGLLFENGTLSGTSLFNSTASSYTVRAENSGGFFLVEFNITVVEPTSVLSINPAEFTILRDDTTMAVQVNNSGGMVEHWHIFPDLPAGLAMENGFISGIATENSSTILYTIWGNNSGGSGSVSFTLTVYESDMVVVTPSPNSTPMTVLYILLALLFFFVLAVTLIVISSRKRVEELKLALAPGQEQEHLRSPEHSESGIETTGATASSQTELLGTSTGANTVGELSSETVIVTATSVDAVAESSQAESRNQSTEGKLLDLPTVVEITEAISGKMLIELPDEVAPSQMLTGKTIVDLTAKPDAAERWTGKEIVDLPDEVAPSQMLSGKKIVNLTAKPDSAEISGGKMVVDLPDEVAPSQMLTGKKIVNLTAKPESAEMSGGKMVVDLPDGLGASEMLTGKKIVNLTAKPESAEMSGGKMVVDLPDGLGASEMLTGKKIDKFPSGHESFQADEED